MQSCSKPWTLGITWTPHILMISFKFIWVMEKGQEMIVMEFKLLQKCLILQNYKTRAQRLSMANLFQFWIKMAKRFLKFALRSFFTYWVKLFFSAAMTNHFKRFGMAQNCHKCEWGVNSLCGTGILNDRKIRPLQIDF